MSSSINYGGKIIRMSFLAMITATEDGVGQIDSDLLECVRDQSYITRTYGTRGSKTYIDVSGVVGGATRGLTRACGD